MAIEVAKVELKSVQDASGLEGCIKAGQFTADQVVAVIGKTEGNGGVNDFTRILADQPGIDEAATKQRRADMAKSQNSPLPMIDRGEGYEKMLRGEHRPRMR